MPSSRPSIDEMRAVCQPALVMERASAEHWAGRLYMRRVSIWVTRELRNWPVTPNQLTVLMMLVGLAGAAAAAVPNLVGAVGAAILIQLYLLLDCVDGELARWRRTTSAVGVYLDRIGHYVVEAALLVGVGMRADGGVSSVGAWTTAGAVGASLVLLTKAESDLVIVARVGGGLPVGDELETAPTNRTLRSLRSSIGRLRIHRAIGGIELSLLLVVAAAVDAGGGTLVGTRVLMASIVAIAAAVALGHPLMIISSGRLR